MSKINLSADEGYADITIGEATCKLDLFRANNTYAALSDQHANPIELADAWIEWLTMQGLPSLSHGAAFSLIGSIQAEVAALKKTMPGFSSENAGSPASIESTPSTSSPPSS